MFAELIVLVVIALIVLVPIVLLAVRIRRGEPTTGGTSWGRQVFGQRTPDWGPKPTIPERPSNENGVTGRAG